MDFVETHRWRVVAQVEQNWRALDYAAEESQADKEIVLIALEQNELKRDREIVLQAVEMHWEALSYATDELRGDRETVLEAVKQDGWALDCAPDELKADPAIVQKTVARNGTSLAFAAGAVAAVAEDSNALALGVYEAVQGFWELRGDREIVELVMGLRERYWPLLYCASSGNIQTSYWGTCQTP
eukprot:5120763-Amphidinium_carterae.1